MVISPVLLRHWSRFDNRRGDGNQVVPPTSLLFVLYDQQKLSKQAFCEGCEDMMKGWTNAGAIYEMWDQIPVDCTGHVDPDLLP